jgi:hypothetical protein
MLIGDRLIRAETAPVRLGFDAALESRDVR